MAVEFAKGLMVSEVVSVEALERALYVAVSNDSPLEHALLDTNALDAARLEEELGRADAPVLHDVHADPALMDRLPAGLCSRLLAVPLRYDARSNTIDLAVVNVFDTHAAEEIAFHLQANVVAVRATLADVEAALRNRPSYAVVADKRPPARKATNRTLPRAVERNETPPPEPVRISKRTPPWGTEVSVLSSLSSASGERISDIPIPLTRRRSIAPGEPSQPPPPPQDSAYSPYSIRSVPEASPSTDDIAALTYARLGGGLSLPDAALVRSKSSNPIPPVNDDGLHVDALPVAAVEVVSRNFTASNGPKTDREDSASAKASVAPPPDTERGLASAETSAESPRAVTVEAETAGAPIADAPAAPIADASNADASTSGPATVAAVPRMPPASVREPQASQASQASHTPSYRPGPLDNPRRPSMPPISVRAPSIRPPGAPGAGASGANAAGGGTSTGSSFGVGTRPGMGAASPPATSLSATQAAQARASGSPPKGATLSFPPPDATHVIASLKTAPDRDAVLGYVLAGARVVARRAAIFVAKRGEFVGWSCTPEFAAQSALDGLTIPQDAPTVLNWAANEGTYLGPLDPSAHGPLLSVMTSATRDVTAVPVRVSGKTALVIVADELGDTMIATKRLEEIARAAGEALLRVLRAGKK